MQSMKSRFREEFKILRKGKMTKLKKLIQLFIKIIIFHYYPFLGCTRNSLALFSIKYSGWWKVLLAD